MAPFPRQAARRRRIVLTTFGSLGDLHPYLALGLGLQARGHEAIVATSAFYDDKVRALGLGFRPVRPDMTEFLADPELVRRTMNRRQGTQAVVSEMMRPDRLRAAYEDTQAAAEGADLLLSHPLTFTTRLVAEKRGLPWASSLLSPLGFFSAYDPPVLPNALWLAQLRLLGPHFHGPLFRLAQWTVRSWSAPLHRLRADLSLPPAPDPLFAGQHSPALVLALFSPLFAPPQPDWPPQTRVTGYPFFDRDERGLPPELVNFLDAGPPPIAFTLGSSAVMDAGAFYEHSAAAAGLLKRHAVLLVGDDPANRPAALPDGVAAFDYAPHAALFPRCAAMVHQGGIGTTAQALRAGKPMVVVPFAHDQPDNAARVTRLGVAATISRERYTAARIAAALRRLLDDPACVQRAAEVGRKVRNEDGVGAACNALEAVLATGRAV
jgi:UDP:flavonoid glycosyltransferase YjiC (YdhE family)